eukprot:387380_1
MQSPHLLNDSIIAGNIAKYSVVVLLVHSAILFGYHLRTFCKNRNKSLSYNTLPIKWLSMLSLFTIVLGSVCAVITAFPFYPSWCGWIMNTASICYICIKMVIYVFFLERLFLLFNNIQTIIKTSRILVILWTIFLITLCMVYGNGYYSIYQKQCVLDYPTTLDLVVIFGYLVIEVFICAILFQAPISISTDITNSIELTNQLATVPTTSNQLQHSTSNQLEHVYNNNTMLDCLLKQLTFFSLIALISTQFCIGMSICLGLDGLFGAFDLTINGWCIIFTFIDSSKFYGIINKCSFCYRCSYYKDMDELDKTSNEVEDSEIGPIDLPKLNQSVTSFDTSNTVGHIVMSI